MNMSRKLFIGFAVSMIIVLPVFGLGMSKIDFMSDTFGQESRAFRSLIGTWHIDKDGSKNVYAVDGRRLQMGLSPGATEHAKQMFGEKSADFLKGIQPLKDFPLTICKEYPEFRNGILTVFFKAISGKEDQAAGLAFNIKQNGEYLAVRANALENNLVLFKFEKGKRSSLQWIDKVPPPKGGWHMLKVIIKGTKIEGFLDDNKYIDYKHNEQISGRMGLWSKADSYVFFDKFMVEPE